MSLTEFFKRIDAPLANSRWSWGGVRPDGAIVLRAWQDEVKRIDDVMYVRVTHHAAFEGDEDNLGFRERLKHVEAIQNGAPGFVVMCLAKDSRAVPRSIKSFNKSDVFVGGRLLEKDGDFFLELTNRVPFETAFT